MNGKGRGRVCLVVYAELLQHKLLGRDKKEQMQIGHVCFYNCHHHHAKSAELSHLFL